MTFMTDDKSLISVKIMNDQYSLFVTFNSLLERELKDY